MTRILNIFRVLLISSGLFVGFIFTLIPFFLYLEIVQEVLPLWITILLVLSPFLIYPLNAKKYNASNWYLHGLYAFLIFFLADVVALMTDFHLPVLDETGCDNFVQGPGDFVFWSVAAVPFALYIWGAASMLAPAYLGKKKGDPYLRFFATSALSLIPSLFLFVIIGMAARTCEAGLH